EITELTPSVQAKESNTTFDEISKVLFQNRFKDPKKQINCLGKIDKSLSKPSLELIISKIIQCIDKCRTNGFEEFIGNGVKFAFAMDDKLNMLKNWGELHDVHSLLEGPSYDVDEIYRLGTKIDKEQEQLPKNHLNIVVIRDTTLFIMFGKAIEEKISRLEEYVYRYNHLAFCIIAATYNGGIKETIKIQGEHMFLHKSSDVVDRDIIFLTNQFIKDKKITPNSTSKIRQSFVEVRNFLL
ncbi:hypothetical protein, partial [Candidatus Nitrosarchaeum limnium]